MIVCDWCGVTMTIDSYLGSVTMVHKCESLCPDHIDELCYDCYSLAQMLRSHIIRYSNSPIEESEPLCETSELVVAIRNQQEKIAKRGKGVSK